ncbi:MAG TPA: hypothetical protein PLG34_10780 [Spirochaetota bacterium]|nr:MAG: hypothetical protein BWX91_02406 [Spirochaetes bacterium ADurb.Bin133]HNZ27014.1 hypothetical protein [Spirochaetota bacterium]HPY88452.1 hypothetical protein [Spirochaetota bacterium]
MNKLGIEDFTSEDINIKIEDFDGGIRVAFIGNIDSQDPDSSLMPFFDRINSKIIENDIKQIELDFLKLNFMNSSGIKVIVKWAQLSLILPEHKSYKFRILANSRVSWQVNSLKFLTMLYPDLIEISII